MLPKINKSCVFRHLLSVIVLMLLMRWFCSCNSFDVMMLLMHRCCWCTFDADALFLLLKHSCCWCNWCCWCPDVICVAVLLMHPCYWSADAIDAIDVADASLMLMPWYYLLMLMHCWWDGLFFADAPVLLYHVCCWCALFYHVAAADACKPRAANFIRPMYGWIYM